jgi:predicted ferric reductase
MSNASTIKYSSGAGVDWAALIAGLGLGLTVAMQLTSMSRADIASPYAAITSFSRLCALVGTYFAVLGIFLIARIPFVERGVGHDRLVTWHRKLAPYSLFLIGFHVLFVAIGYAGLEQIPTIIEIWRMVTRFPWMLPAFVGFIFMMAAGITSYKKARARMSYETWWTVHLYTYLAIALSFMHQVLTGPMFIGHPLNRFFWNVLYLAVAATLITWRFAIPVIRSLRLGLKVEQVIKEGPGVFSIIMKGRNVDSLGAQGGQFFGWRFLTKGHWFISHPYSLSAAPTKKYLRVTVKDLGDHSGSVTFIKPETRVFLEGPYGAFTAGRASKGHVTLIGGGVGITPIRAIMEEFPPNVEVDVIFRASKKEDLVLKEELDYLAEERGARVHYLIGPRSEHPMDAKYIMRIVPTFRDSDVYICGPTPLVDAVREAARNVGIPKNRFHDEAFAFHGE